LSNQIEELEGKIRVLKGEKGLVSEFKETEDEYLPVVEVDMDERVTSTKSII
jgi:hypothetical protein